MKNNMKIIRVNASFEEGKKLFDWLKKYAKRVDEQFVYWDEFAFTAEDLSECDAVLIFNNPSKKIQVDCFPGNVLAFMMEPGIYSEHPWMFKGLDQYSKVYSPVKNAANTVLSHGYLGWYLQQDYHSLSSLQVPEKPLSISCIASDLTKLKGHRLRMDFIDTLKKELPQIDFFGKGTHFIKDKTEGLLPYRFSIAIENTSAPYYFTEKINDCFLTYTVPLYYGCTNIGKYFPEGAFIPINIEEPAQAVKMIKQAIEKDDWQQRIGALHEARELVLNKYQPLAGAAAILREQHPTVKKQVTLKPLPATIAQRLKKLLRTD